jgi:hypothetical protein
MDHSPSPLSWPAALLGLFLTVFAVLALTSPGRIDIIDGQARYEVARSLVEHGDVVVRDPDLWYGALPGRDGQLYSFYRLPQTLLGMPAILLADATGPTSEARRHFFFSLTSAVAGAVLALAYAVWFRDQGFRPRAAVGWALGGVFCTPNWYYGTSTFDDILGTTCVVWALVCAARSRQPSMAWAVVSGLWLGAAFHSKQPLGIYVLPALALAITPAVSWRSQLGRLALIVVGLAVGVITSQAYEWYRFPEGMPIGGNRYDPPVKGRSPLSALLALLVSPSAGVLWYCPAIVLGLGGLARVWRTERLWAVGCAAATAVFVCFIATLGFFKGDIGWGPRYLTPVVAVLWLFAPVAAAFRPTRAAAILGAAILVQLLSLGADPHRLYLRNNFHPSVLLFDYRAYYDLRTSHLVWRPAEIWEVLTKTEPSEQISPAPDPTYALPLPSAMADASDPDRPLRRYRLFNALRPWWHWHPYLSPDERPVNIDVTLAMFLAMAVVGSALAWAGTHRQEDRP